MSYLSHRVLLLYCFTCIYIRMVERSCFYVCVICASCVIWVVWILERVRATYRCDWCRRGDKSKSRKRTDLLSHGQKVTCPSLSPRSRTVRRDSLSSNIVIFSILQHETIAIFLPDLQNHPHTSWPGMQERRRSLLSVASFWFVCDSLFPRILK